MSTAAPDTKTITEDLRYNLTNDDIASLALQREEVAKKQERLDEEFESKKARYKLDTTDIETELTRISGKIRDRFEMRPTQLEVSYNDPERGRKTTRRMDNGETIRVESMTAADIEQRTLPLEASPFLFLAAFLPDWEAVRIDHFGSDTRKVELIMAAPIEGLGVRIFQSRFGEVQTSKEIEWRSKLAQLGYSQDEIELVAKSRAATTTEKDESEKPNGIEPHPNLTADGQRTGTLSQTEGGDNAGETPVGQILDKATIEKEQPKVPFDLKKFTDLTEPDARLAVVAFCKVAKKKWDASAVTIIREQCSRLLEGEGDNTAAVFAILEAHSTQPAS